MNTTKIKRRLTTTDIFLLVINLIPVWGVWFDQWNAREAFMVYCLETIIIGLFTILKMAIAGSVRKTDLWNSTENKVTKQPVLFFIFFFIVHYGMFVAIQLSIFLSVSGVEKEYGISNAFDFVIHFRRYLSENSQWFLLGLIISYAFIMLKDFVLSGAFRSTPLNMIMFEPYGRIFIQQFTVIAGSLFIGMGADKVFISIFAAVKIFFDVFVNYQGIFQKMGKEQEVVSGGQQ